MRFALCIEQNVPRFNVSVQNAMLVCVVNGSRHLGDQFRRASRRHRFPPNYLVELSTFDEFHAEITGAIALTDFVNRNNAWMLEAGGSFRFTTETFYMRFGGPISKANHFESDSAVQTF